MQSDISDYETDVDSSPTKRSFSVWSCLFEEEDGGDTRGFDVRPDCHSTTRKRCREQAVLDEDSFECMDAQAAKRPKYDPVTIVTDPIGRHVNYIVTTPGGGPGLVSLRPGEGFLPPLAECLPEIGMLGPETATQTRRQPITFSVTILPHPNQPKTTTPIKWDLEAVRAAAAGAFQPPPPLQSPPSSPTPKQPLPLFPDEPGLRRTTFCGLDVSFSTTCWKKKLVRRLLQRLRALEQRSPKELADDTEFLNALQTAGFLAPAVLLLAQRHASRRPCTVQHAMPVLCCNKILFSAQSCCAALYDADSSETASVAAMQSEKGSRGSPPRHYVLGVLELEGCTAESFVVYPPHRLKTILLQLLDGERQALLAALQQPSLPDPLYKCWQKEVLRMDAKQLVSAIERHKRILDLQIDPVQPHFYWKNSVYRVHAGMNTATTILGPLVWNTGTQQETPPGRCLSELDKVELMAMYMQLYPMNEKRSAMDTTSPLPAAVVHELPEGCLEAQLCCIEASTMTSCCLQYGSEERTEIVHWVSEQPCVVRALPGHSSRVQLVHPVVALCDVSGLACQQNCSNTAWKSIELKRAERQPRIFPTTIVWTLQPAAGYYTSAAPSADAPCKPVLGSLPSSPQKDTPSCSAAYCHHTAWLELKICSTKPN